MKGLGVWMCLLAVSATLGYRKMAEYGRNILKQLIFKHELFQAVSHVTYGHRDMRIGPNERSWYLDVPFDTFDHRKLTEYAKKKL